MMRGSKIVNRYLAIFASKFCHQDLLLMAQSGHAVRDKNAPCAWKKV